LNFFSGLPRWAVGNFLEEHDTVWGERSSTWKFAKSGIHDGQRAQTEKILLTTKKKEIAERKKDQIFVEGKEKLGGKERARRL